MVRPTHQFQLILAIRTMAHSAMGSSSTALTRQTGGAQCSIPCRGTQQAHRTQAVSISVSGFKQIPTTTLADPLQAVGKVSPSMTSVYGPTAECHLKARRRWQTSPPNHHKRTAPVTVGSPMMGRRQTNGIGLNPLEITGLPRTLKILKLGLNCLQAGHSMQPQTDGGKLAQPRTPLDMDRASGIQARVVLASTLMTSTATTC